jgi:hypothetical protein
MSLFVPRSAGFDASCNILTDERFLRLMVDADLDGTCESELTTPAAGWMNDCSGGGKLEGANNEAISNSWQFKLRNAGGTYQEGVYAGCKVTIESKVGAANEYIVNFTGYISDAGAERTFDSLNGDMVSFTVVDVTKVRAVNRMCDPEYLVNFKILNTASPTTSIFHRLAGYLGLATSDLDVVTINYTKDFVGFTKTTDVWKEMQDLASAYLGILTFRYDGLLRLVSFFQTGYSVPTSEWSFTDENSWKYSVSVSPVVCNRVKTEFETRETLSSRIVHKNTTAYNETTGKCSIAVLAGEYWPGGAVDTDIGLLGFSDPNSGEEWDTAIDRITPTIGADGSGSDIESTGGVLTLESFEGTDGTDPTKTTPEYKGAQIILKNETGSTVTITKFTVRAKPVRIEKKNIVEDIDAAITDEWEYRRKEVSGRYMSNTTQAHQTLNWWKQQGMARRRVFKFTTHYLPQIQEGAIIDIDSASRTIDCDAQVTDFNHNCKGATGTWTTSITCREWATFTPADNPVIEVVPQPSPATNTAELLNTLVTTTTIQAGYTTGGGTKTPTTPTIASCQPVGMAAIQVQWDGQLNLTNFDHYEVQVSDDNGATVYALRFDGVDWKGTENDHTDWPSEFIVHPNIPFGGTTDAPVGVLLYYRVRRVTKEPVESSWSTWSSATTSTIDTGMIAEDAITLNKLSAAVISTMLLKATTAYIGFNSVTGTTTQAAPGEGDTVIKLSVLSIAFLEYTGGAWVTSNSIAIGGFIAGLFLNMIGCGGIYHPANPPTATELLPNPYFRVFGFNNVYTDQNGLDDWSGKTEIAFSSTEKKFGTHSLYANSTKWANLLSPSGGTVGASQAFGAFFKMTSTGVSSFTSSYSLLKSGPPVDSIAIGLRATNGSAVIQIYYEVNKTTGGVVSTQVLCNAPSGWFGLYGVYNSVNDHLYIIVNNTIYDSGALGGTWGAGSFDSFGIRIMRDYVASNVTYNIWADELLFYWNKYLDPNLLAQHYNHNVAWDTTYSRADLLYKPNIDGRNYSPVGFLCPRAIIAHSPASGTQGGALTAGAFYDIPWDTVQEDTIGVTLSSNGITLPAGIYEIRAYHQMCYCRNAHVKLINATDSTLIIEGDSGYVYDNSTENYNANAKWTIASPKILKMQYRVNQSVATYGLGYANSYGTKEKYGEIEITRVG